MDFRILISVRVMRKRFFFKSILDNYLDVLFRKIHFWLIQQQSLDAGVVVESSTAINFQMKFFS
jgi:hypothetical protein